MSSEEYLTGNSPSDPETNAEFSDSPFFRIPYLTGRLHQGMRDLRLLKQLQRCCESISMEKAFTIKSRRNCSVQSFVAFYVKRLPFEKRLALDKFLQGCIRCQKRRVNLSPVE